MELINMTWYFELAVFLSITIPAIPHYFWSKKITKIATNKVYVGDFDLTKWKYVHSLLIPSFILTGIMLFGSFDISTILKVVLWMQVAAWVLQVPTGLYLYKRLYGLNKHNTGSYNVNFPNFKMVVK